MKKDFPFVIAFILALCLHFAAGFALRQGGLFAASPAPPRPPAPPVTLRFVEVPPNATTIPEPPRTSNLSDANRKAGPLQPNGPKRPVVQQPSVRPGPRTARPGPPGPPGPPQQAQQQPSARPPASSEPEGADIKATPTLSQSLEKLDRYIEKGQQSGGGGGGGQAGGDGGNLPTGDPGSGVFFDTQGYDLGPWVNRVVEIVRSNWLIPVAAELGMKGIVSVSFKVARDGTIRDLKMISSSTVPSFDQAAVRALQSSSPLPALPADFPRDLLPGIFRFYYNTPVPQAAQ